MFFVTEFGNVSALEKYLRKYDVTPVAISHSNHPNTLGNIVVIFRSAMLPPSQTPE
jgi:hypothetical protein